MLSLHSCSATCLLFTKRIATSSFTSSTLQLQILSCGWFCIKTFQLYSKSSFGYFFPSSPAKTAAGSALRSSAVSPFLFNCFKSILLEAVFTNVKRPSVSWLVSSPFTTEMFSPSSSLTAFTYVSKSEWINSISGYNFLAVSIACGKSFCTGWWSHPFIKRSWLVPAYCLTSASFLSQNFFASSGSTGISIPLLYQFGNKMPNNVLPSGDCQLISEYAVS